MPAPSEATRREVLQAWAGAVVLQQTETDSGTIGELAEEADPSIEYGEQGYGEERYGGGLLPPIPLPGTDGGVVDRARDRVSRARERVESLFDDDDEGGPASSEEPNFVSRLLERLFGDDEDGSGGDGLLDWLLGDVLD